MLSFCGAGAPNACHVYGVGRSMGAVVGWNVGFTEEGLSAAPPCLT